MFSESCITHLDFGISLTTNITDNEMKNKLTNFHVRSSLKRKSKFQHCYIAKILYLEILKISKVNRLSLKIYYC